MKSRVKQHTKSASTSYTSGQLTAPSQQILSTAQMLEVLVNNVKEYAIILLDKDGKVMTWNAAAQRLKGWSAEEIIGQHFSRFYPPEDNVKGKTTMELREAEEKGRFEDEGWRVRKDGTRYWANVVITALRNEKGEIVAFGKVTRDMSDRRDAEEKIKKQAVEIMEMATVPVVQVWEGIVMVPIIGTLDSQRTQQLMEGLLHRVAETGSPVALLDITGVSTVDSQTAQHLIETTSAVRLLGAEVILTGVRPSIAQTLVHLGIDLSNIITRASLASGLRKALDMLDQSVARMPAATTRA